MATCGTALGEEHCKLLRNFATRVVLAFDADAAGQSAAGRFYEWERQHEIDVAVAALPPGSDPADLARSDPDALRAAVAEAKPFLRFRVERILDAADLATPEGRAKAADAALAAVAEHPDDLVRDQYLMQVAERCRLEPLLLRERLERLRRDGPRPTSSAGTGRRRARRTSPGPGAAGAARSESGPGEPWVREPDESGWDDDGFDGGANRMARGRGRVRTPVNGMAAEPRGRPAPIGRSERSGPDWRRSAWPSTDPRTSATGWRPCCSVTNCSGPPSSPWSTPTTCTRPSIPPRPTCGPCWCG